MNDAVAESLGLEIRRYTLRSEDGFQIDMDEVRRLTDRRTKFVLVNSPHNPTGAVVPESDMEELHDFCVNKGIQIVSDEVYHPIYHGPPLRSAARLPGATVISDFSKAFCLSGLRIGWMIERDRTRREQYLNARSYFTVSSTVLAERLAALATRRRERIYQRARRVAHANLQLLDAVFSAHADSVQWIRPGGGMTAFPWLASGADARGFCRIMAQSGVLVVPGDCFGMPAHFRIGFAASGDRFPKAIERFAAVLETIGSRQRQTAV
jgi:aspartate/methionine/tyrosine aminotransferase